MKNCPSCNGSDLRIQFMLGVSAPASLEGKFSKSSFKSKDVSLTHANWDSCITICTNHKCLWTDNGYSNWINSTVEERDKLLEYKESREKILEELYDFIQLNPNNMSYKNKLESLYDRLNKLGYGRVLR